MLSCSKEIVFDKKWYSLVWNRQDVDFWLQAGIHGLLMLRDKVAKTINSFFYTIFMKKLVKSPVE